MQLAPDDGQRVGGQLPKTRVVQQPSRSGMVLRFMDDQLEVRHEVECTGRRGPKHGGRVDGKTLCDYHDVQSVTLQ